MRLLLSLFTGILLTLTARSQDFNYTVTADSVAWNELNSQTILNANNSAWSFSYRIPIGFSFNYLGRNFDSLTIETNGYLVFDGDRDYAFTAFNQFGDRISGGIHAVIGYEISGTAGNRILKIQYKNTGQYSSDLKYQTWQIWLKENGEVVEVRVGPGTYRYRVYVDEETEEVVSELDLEQYCRIGLLNQNMNGEINGLFLDGDVYDPEPVQVDTEHPETAFMTTMPSQGLRYTFTPAVN